MKLRYYLRGLGIGIVVTAIIMSFTRQPEKLTDAQIKMRALELGMVEESVLADLQKDEEVTYEETVMEETEIPEVTENEELVEEEPATEEDMTDEINSEKVDGEEIEEETTVVEVTEEDTIVESDVVDGTVAEETDVENIVVGETVIKEPETGNIADDEVIESYVVISVASGNGSEVVSRKLYEAGLVNSAVEYNQFLVRNGYDRKLRVGNHEIPAGATEEEMAKILCGMK